MGSQLEIQEEALKLPFKGRSRAFVVREIHYLKFSVHRSTDGEPDTRDKIDDLQHRPRARSLTLPRVQ